MIGRIYAIAANTFREAIRNKILYGIVAVVLMLNLFAMILGEMSLHQEARVARDVGLTGVSLFGSITAIVLGVSLLHREISRRTIHTLISKPINRWEFVLGKYLGMSFTLIILVSLFILAMAGLLHLQEVSFSSSITKAALLSTMEVLIVAGIAIFFSSFSTPYLSGIFTFVAFFVGRVTPQIRSSIENSEMEWIRDSLSVAIRIVPDLHIYSVSGATVKGEYVSVHSDFVTWGYVGTAGLYTLLYLGILLTLAIVIFSRRDFA